MFAHDGLGTRPFASLNGLQHLVMLVLCHDQHVTRLRTVRLADDKTGG
jgi:hypothetical protein